VNLIRFKKLDNELLYFKENIAGNIFFQINLGTSILIIGLLYAPNIK